MSRIHTKRIATATVAAVSFAMILSSCSASTDSADGSENQTIVVSTFAFGVEEFQEAIIDPFEEATGITVEVETGSNADRLSSLELAGDDSGIDVMLISDFYAALGQDTDLFDSVDADLVPNLETISDFAVSDEFNGPAYSYQLNGVLYNTDELTAEEASSWDLYGNSEYTGRLAFPNISTSSGQLSVAAVADTYGDDAYDIDTALTTIGEWAPNILQFVASSTEITNLITQGEIVASPILNGFATSLVASGEPLAWTATDTGKYMTTNRAMIPAGSQNTEAANEFINYLLSVEAQTASAEIVGDLPVNPEATVPSSLTDVVGDIAADPAAAGFETLDFATIVTNYDDWVDRFAREVTTK